MQTKFQVRIYGHGSLTPELVELIGKNNSGDFDLQLTDFESYIKCKKTIYSGLYRALKWDIEMNELIIFENGEDVSLVISEQEVHELKETN